MGQRTAAGPGADDDDVVPIGHGVNMPAACELHITPHGWCEAVDSNLSHSAVPCSPPTPVFGAKACMPAAWPVPPGDTTCLGTASATRTREGQPAAGGGDKE